MQHCYSDLGAALQGVCQQWCQQYDYTDPFCHDGEWWAFPAYGVMPIRIRDILADADFPPQWVQIGHVAIALLPDGSFATY